MHGRGPFRSLLDPQIGALAQIGFTADAEASGGSADGASASTEADADTSTDTDDNNGLGFPAKTPWRDMTAEQQAAYWRHQSKGHESRAKENATAARERDELKAKHQTESEKAIEAAREEGRTEARAQVAEQLVSASFTAALTGRLTREQIEAFVDGLNHTKFLDAKGKVDTAKISEHVEAFAPKGDGTTRQKVDTGGGKTAAAVAKPSVQSGMDRYAERHATRSKASVTAA